MVVIAALAGSGVRGQSSLGSAFTVFDRTFTRSTGAPQTEQAAFGAQNPGTYRLVITSHEAASAVVTLNGDSVAQPKDFTSRRQQFARSVTLRAENILRVEVRGKPGGYVRIAINGTDVRRPSIRGVVSPPPNGKGWNSTDATVSFECSDAHSGIASCTEPVSVATEGADQLVTGIAVDRVGLATEAKVFVSIDKTAPRIVGTASPEPNALGWHRSDVKVSFTCLDDLSKIAECTERVTVPSAGNEGTRDVPGSAADGAGNRATASVRLNIDATAPTIVATPDRPPDAGGWYTAPVVVSFACHDDRSGIAVCPEPVRVTTNGTDIVVPGTAIDRAGNSSTAKFVLNMRAVGTAPGLAATVTPLPNAAGWNNTEVTVTFACEDSGSGIGSCPPAQTIAADGITEITATASDTLGNVRTITLTVRIDRTPPVVTAAVNPPLVDGNASSPVTITFTCEDTGSGVADCPAARIVDTEGLGQVVTGVARDTADNVAQASVTINLTLSGPSIRAVATPLPNAEGWNNTPVTVTFECAGAIGSCPSPITVSTEGEGQIVRGEVTDATGRRAAASLSLNLDFTAPQIAPAIQPLPNASGWNNSDVLVSFTCDDTGSGVHSCPPPQPLVDEGTVEASATAADRAGNTRVGTVSVRIDRTPPTITAAIDPPLVDGFANGPVTITFTCADSGSGVAGCPPARVVDTEGLGQVVTGAATDAAGNTAQASVSVNLVLSAVTIRAVATPQANAAGWNNTPVTVTFECADARGPIATCAAPVTVSTEGAGQVVSGEFTDAAGRRVSASIALNIDLTPPQITPAVQPPANGSGWHTQAATVSFVCADPLSGIAACTAPTGVAEGAGQVVAGTAVDRAGNSATATMTVNVDANPPSLVATMTPPPNAAGWHNSDVTIAFDCADPGAGVAECPAAITLTAEAANQTVNRTVVDRAGNSASITTQVSIDRTPPAISITAPANNAVVLATPVRVTGGVTDTLSGVAAIVCGSTAVSTGAVFECAAPLVPGANAILVRVVDAAGNEATSIRTVQFQSNREPRAIPGGPYAGVAGVPVSFNGSASFDPDGHLLTYAWRFGDSAIGTGAQPTHIYAAAGSYTVTLTVDDGNGGVHEASATVNVVRANTVPTARIGGPYATDVNAAIIFDATASTDADGDSLSASWTFGDGGTATGLTPNYTYRSVGTFTATVTVRDGRAGTASASTQVTVRAANRVPTAYAGGPYRGEVSRPVVFDAAASADPDGDALTFAWAFGDGGVATGASPSHVYAASGIFQVTVTVTDPRGGSAAASSQVTVTPANATPTAEANGPYAQEVGFPIAFTSAGSSDPDGDVLTFTWRFGDGRVNTGPASSTSYLTPGTYTVELTVDDGRGGVGVDTATVTIAPRATEQNRNPVAVAGGPYQVEGGVPIALNPAGSVDPDGDPLSFAWSFGDGGSSTDRAPHHAWADAGQFTVTLTVSDGRGGSAVATASVTVSAPTDRAPPLVTLVGPSQVLPGTSVTVIALVHDASAITRVTFVVDGETTVDDAPPYEHTVAIPPVASPGATVVLRATAVDAAGNSGTREFVMAISALPDTTAPAVSLTGPTQAAPGSTSRFTADASDESGVREVSFQIDDQPIGVDREPPYEISFVVSPDAQVGAILRISARASDFTGNESEASRDLSVTAAVDSQAPTLTLSAPPTATPGTNVRAVATPTDNVGISTVRFRVDGAIVAELTAAPFEIDIPVPAATPAGSLIRIEGTAIDFGGLEARASTSVRVTSPLTAGEGLITGEVYDDLLGIPLQGARILMRMGGAAPIAVESDARGSYLIAAPAGEAALTISREGWTTVVRSIEVNAGQVAMPIDARLTPYDPSRAISPVLGGTLVAGPVQLRAGPGAVQQPTELRARRLSAQGLRGLLPMGWSPVDAIDVSPSTVSFATPVQLEVAVSAEIAPGRMLHLVRWDDGASGWRAIAAQAFVTALPLSAAIPGTGQYVWVVGDLAPAAAPAPAVGELLAGVAATSLPADAVANLAPQPRLLIYEPGVRSDVSTEVPVAQPVSSGTRLQATIEESYHFTNNSTVRVDPLVQDLFFHQPLADTARLRATYPVSASIAFESIALREGVITVEIHEPAPSGALSAVGSLGGSVSGEGGVRLDIPSGAVGALTSASVRALPADSLGLALPDGVSFVGGGTVSLSGALDRAGLLSIARPGTVAEGATLLLLRVAEVDGASRLMLVALGRVAGDRIDTVLQLPRNGIPLAGVRQAGRYAFVSIDAAAFVFGRVLGANGDSFAGALVTTDTVGIAAQSATDGAYVAVTRPLATRVTALDIPRRDAGSGRVVPAGVADELALDLRLQAAPPHVTSITPADGAVNVSLVAPIAVRFSEPIDPASVSVTALIVDSQGAPVAGALALTDGDTLLTFRPAGEFANDTEYRVRVADVRDRSGLSLVTPFIARFFSLDTIAPPPPAAGSLSASIPDGGYSTVAASQGTAGAHDTITVINSTRGTATPVLVEPNGGFSVRVAAAFTDRLQIVITDRGGNRTTVAAPAFRQTNADGSISTAVTVDGGRVEGPGGVAVDVPQGAFPQGTVVTLKPVSEAQFPVALSAEQRQVFRYSGGIDIDFAGRVPTTYLNVSIATTGGETLDDQWIVGQVTYLDGQVFLDAADTARVIDGRIRTSSPPCPGVTGSGVYGFLKSARPLGVTYAGIPNPNSQVSAQLLVAAIVPMALVPGTLRMPIFMPAVAGAAIAMAEAVHAEFLNQSRQICMPLLSGRITISASTVQLQLQPSEFERVVELTVTNLATSRTERFFQPFDETVTVEGSNTDAFQVRGIDWAGSARTLTATVAPRSYVQVLIANTELTVNDTQIKVTNLTRNKTWASGISSSASRPLGSVSALLEGQPGDSYRADVTDNTGAIRTATFGIAPYAVGNGNLIVRSALGTIDPTQAQLDAYNAGLPPELQAHGSPVVHVSLVRPDGSSETILDVAAGDTARVVDGAFLYAFNGLVDRRYSVYVRYENGRVDSVDIPTFEIKVRRGLVGTEVKEIVGQVPARGEPLLIDLGLSGAPATLLTEPDGFFHIEAQSPITLSFSQALDRQSVADHLKLMVADASGNPIEVSGTWELSNGNRSVTFVPTWPLKMGKTYQAVMNGVTAGGEPLSVGSLPIKTFAPVKLSTTVLPHPVPSLGPGLPFGDLEIVRQPTATGQLGTSLLASTTAAESAKLHIFDVSLPQAPVKVGQTSGGMPKRLKVVPGIRHPQIDVQYDVPLVGQQSGMSCWAASAAMVVAFRDQYSVDPFDLVDAVQNQNSSGGYWQAFRDGINFATASTEKLFNVWGLTPEPVMTLTVTGMRDMLAQYGPLWVGTAGAVGGHVRVITGIVGDGTPEGTFVTINDPWGLDSQGLPMKRFRPPNAGSQYRGTVHRVRRGAEASGSPHLRRHQS